jgi:hypothetical protein
LKHPILFYFNQEKKFIVLKAPIKEKKGNKRDKTILKLLKN